MSMLRILTSLAVAGAALPTAEALLVAPGSPCAPDCGNVLDSTSNDDIVCSQNQYSSGNNNNGAGQVFQSCIQCELGSPYATSSNYTDAMALLYNLRYTVSSCVFDYPDNNGFIDTPCVTNKACGPFMDAITHQNLSTKSDDFGFCDAWPVDDSIDFDACIECLQAGSNNYLANFVTVIQAGCTQKPLPGATVAVQGNLFSIDVVNVTAPTPIAKVDPAWFDQGPLTLGAKVGIAVGGLLLMLVIAGIAIVWNGKRQRRAFLRTLEATYATAKGNNGGWPSPSPIHRDVGETPLSQRPLRGWDDSPMTINTEKTFPRYFSPYSSQFNSPVSATSALQMPLPETVLTSPREIGLALGDSSHHDRWPSSPKDKGKRKDEAYEMQHVDGAGGENNANRTAVRVEAPILSHPGYGRSSDSPPRQYNVAG